MNLNELRRLKNQSMLFSDLLDKIANDYGDQPAVTCGGTLNYLQLRDISQRNALALANLGVQKGDKVVLWASNCLEWLPAFFGVAMAGGVAVLLNYGLNASDVTSLTGQVAAKWAIMGGSGIYAKDPECAKQALIAAGVPAEHVISLYDLFRESMNASADVDRAAYDALKKQNHPEDTQCIIFTTGTTSLPKAVQLSSRGIILNALLAVEHLLDGDLYDNICVALPLFHSYGLLASIFALSANCHLILAETIHPVSIAKLIAEKKAGMLLSVGAVCSTMADFPDFEEKVSPTVRRILLGGGFTDPEELRRLENKLHGGIVLTCYGLSECSPGISCNVSSDPFEWRANTAGRIIQGIDARIWREGDGFLGVGEIGELVVKSPCNMNGYLGLPPEEQPIDADGWLHTGDLAAFTEEGLLQLKGRVKDIIKRAGEGISPAEIEEALLKEPSIREAKVVGVPDPIWGETVEACVVLSDGELDEKRLRLSLRKKLSPQKVPNHIFAFQAFPVKTNGKADQLRLKEMVMERLRALKD